MGYNFFLLPKITFWITVMVRIEFVPVEQALGKGTIIKDGSYFWQPEVR